jgi:hypothetical protein
MRPRVGCPIRYGKGFWHSHHENIANECNDDFT